jgi:hypothetical protein
VRQYILFHNKRHPKEMGAVEIKQFITHLVVDRKASAFTYFILAVGAREIKSSAPFSSSTATSCILK